MRPSFRRSLRINSEDRLDASIHAMASNGIAISKVAKPISREISAIRLSSTRIALSTKIVGPSDLDFWSISPWSLSRFASEPAISHPEISAFRSTRAR